jgi:hypothetical protein
LKDAWFTINGEEWQQDHSFDILRGNEIEGYESLYFKNKLWFISGEISADDKIMNPANDKRLYSSVHGPIWCDNSILD